MAQCQPCPLKTQNVINLHGLMQILTSRLEVGGWSKKKKKIIGENAWLDWHSPTREGRYIWSQATTIKVACSMSPGPNNQPGQPLWSLLVCMIGWLRWSRLTHIWSWLSHHISFIHTSYSDEQCITQKYKGKILVLHYTVAKIYTE